MPKVEVLDKKELLGRLPDPKYNPEEATGGQKLDQMSLAKSLLKLTSIDQDSEYELCRQAAEWLMEEVPEPDDSDLDFNDLEEGEQTETSGL